MIAFLTLLAITVGIYLVMVIWSLPKIADAAGGLLPFDLRPAGYTFDEAHVFLSSLSETGSAFYRDVQLWLDTAYPPLLAVTLALALFWAWRDVPRLIPMIFFVAAVVGAGFDYTENAKIGAMLSVGADGITPELVASASRASVAKAVLTTVAMVGLLAGLVWRGWQRRKQRS